MHRQMSRQTRLAADNDKVLYSRAPRNTHLGTDNAVPPDLHVAGDLNQIIDLRTIAHRRFAETRPVEGRIGADLDIIANHHRADFRNLRMPTIAPLPRKTWAPRSGDTPARRSAPLLKSRIQSQSWHFPGSQRSRQSPPNRCTPAFGRGHSKYAIRARTSASPTEGLETSR